MKGLALALGGDVGTQDISRILRLPGTFNMKLADNPRPVEIIWCEPERLYSLADFAEYKAPAQTQTSQKKRHSGSSYRLPDPRTLMALNIPAWAKTLILTGAKEGYPSRSERDHAVIGELLRVGCNLDTIEEIFQAHPVGDKYREKGPQGRAYLQASINKILSEPRTTQAPPINQAMPPHLAETAYYGLAGEFVRLVEPHTEADPVALLSQFLVYFGNVLGPGPYYQVESDYHHLKLFVNLVGGTSKARKGTSHGHIRNAFIQIDPVWTKNRIVGGLSSGEGLIWEVRDPITKREPIRKGGSLQANIRRWRVIQESWIRDC